MKKTLLLFCFFLSILRGPLFAQNFQITTSVVRTDSICSFKYRVTTTATGGTQPYRFVMDSTVTSSTGIFSNVSSGYHFIQVFDANGQSRFASVNLDYGGVQWRAVFETISNSCTVTSIATYKLNVTGGQPPFTYRINDDSLVTTTNSFNLQPLRSYKVVIDDAIGCSTTMYVETPPAQYFEVKSDFLPNRCGDSIGSVKLKIRTNLILTTPLSISFNGRPFSSDTIFTNIPPRGYSVVVKTLTCGDRSVTTYPISYGAVWASNAYFNVTDCAGQKGRLGIVILGGSPPFKFTLNGQSEQIRNETFAQWENISVGTAYTIRVQTAEGCVVTKTGQTKESLYFPYDYVATCGQMATLRMVNNSGNPNSRYKLDNQNAALDASGLPFWQNISAGRHVLVLTDTVGCVVGDSTLTFYSQGNFNTVFTRANGTCVDSLFKINVTGGTPPYTYRVNEGLPTTNNILNLNTNGYYNIDIVDANYCRSSATLNGNSTVFRQDSVRITTTFTAQNCSSNLADIRIAVPDTNAARPLSMSFNGRPFSADTFFTNVPTGQGYAVLVKSKQGCDMRSIFSVPRVNSALTLIVRDTCANRFGRGSIDAYAYGGTNPYTCRWSNGSTSFRLNDAPIGTYSVTITDANGCSGTRTVAITSCVWSGDTDTSGVVDSRDLLNIGVAFGETGPVTCIDSIRNPFCTLWYGRKAQNWSKQTAAGANYKHIDTNGDGIINAKDTLAITRNWNLTHALRNPNTPIATERSAVPPIFIQTRTVREGDMVSFPIMLGEASATADNIYGLAFSVKYPPSVIEVNSMRLAVNQSWIGASSELLNVFKDEFDNVFHVGLVKTNRLNSTGSGQIATLTFKLKTGTKGSDLQFGVYNDLVINNVGQQITSVGRTTTVKVLTATADPIWANQIQVYPNPTTGNVFIDAQNLDIQTITLMDIAGKMIQKIEKNGPLSIKAVGTYFLKIETDKGVVMKKIVKL